MNTLQDGLTEFDQIFEKPIVGLLEESRWDRETSESFTATPPATSEMSSPPATAVDPGEILRRASDTSSVSKPSSRENSPEESELDIDAIKAQLDAQYGYRSKGMEIKVLGVPSKEARSRVETQIKICIQLVAANGSMVPYWEHLRIPENMLSSQERVRRSKALNTNADDKTVLDLDAVVVCATNPAQQVLMCQGCMQRERKRARKKGDDSNEELERQRIVLFNTNSLTAFGGDIILPTRITCYCRHHKELIGFCIYFMFRDSAGNLVATGISPPILITDDHKAHAKMVALAKTDVNRSRKRQRIDDDLPTLKQEEDFVRPISQPISKRPQIIDDSVFSQIQSPNNESQVHQLFQILQNQVASPSNVVAAAVAAALSPPEEPTATISKVVPGEGPLHGGVEITILGTNFTNGLTVLFGNTPATATQYWNSNTLVCLLPPAAVAGPVLVTFQGQATYASGPPPVTFLYKDDSERALMEIALQIVGLRLSGKLEDAKQVAFRILGETQEQTQEGQVVNYQAQLLANASANQLNLSTSALESLLLDAFAVYDVGPAHVLALNANGHSMLHLSVMANMPRLAKWLAKRGGNVLIECPDERVGGWTALMWASFLGRSECVEVLIQQGADGWCVDDDDRTARDLALESNHKPIAALLDNVYGMSDSDTDSDSSESSLDSAEDVQDGPSILLANAGQDKMQTMEVHASVQSESETEDDVPTSYTNKFWDMTDRWWSTKKDPASPTHTTTTSMQGLPIQLSVFSWAGQSSSRGQNSPSDKLERRESALQMLWLPILTAIVAIFVFAMLPSKFEGFLWDVVNVHVFGRGATTRAGEVGNHAWVPAA